MMLSLPTLEGAIGKDFEDEEEEVEVRAKAV